MATQGRTEAAPVMDGDAREGMGRELLDDVHSFRFFQAVRLLQRVHPDRAGVGRFGDPGDEVVRFGANPDLSFPASEIDELEAVSEGPWRMRVNFMGLVGHLGVLPHHYSVLVAERTRQRDTALRDFLDLLHHRLLSLFYRAWERYRFYAVYERGEEDAVTAHLYDLIGLGDRAAREALDIDARRLLPYVGLLGPHQRSAGALEQLLEDYFDVPVEIEQFVGGWYELADSTRCRVDEERLGESNRLGYGALVGDEVWDPNSRARIVIGPLPLERYREFLPTGSAYRELRALTRFFSDDEIEFEVRLVLDRDEVPAISLGADDTAPLGWASWLRSQPFEHDASDTVLTL